MKSKIITLPHPSLRMTSKNIGRINATTQKLIEQLQKQALLWEASRTKEMTVGLAAVQINRLLRVIIIRQENRDQEKKIFQPLINPTLEKSWGEKEIQPEGCLSIPNYYTQVSRPKFIVVRALDQNGRRVYLKAADFLARILQHEIDHLNGILAVDRVITQVEAEKNNLSFRFARLNQVGEFEGVNEDYLEKEGILKK